MTDAALHIFVRTVLRRMNNGESLDDILDSYPKLSEEDKQQIKDFIENMPNNN